MHKREEVQKLQQNPKKSFLLFSFFYHFGFSSSYFSVDSPSPSCSCSFLCLFFLLKCSTCKYLLRFHSFFVPLSHYTQRQMVKAKDSSDHWAVCFYCIHTGVIYNLLPFHNTHADNTNKLSTLTGQEIVMLLYHMHIYLHTLHRTHAADSSVCLLKRVEKECVVKADERMRERAYEWHLIEMGFSQNTIIVNVLVQCMDCLFYVSAELLRSRIVLCVGCCFFWVVVLCVVSSFIDNFNWL